MRKRIAVHITHACWAPPIYVDPDMDLRSPTLEKLFLDRVHRVRATIDRLIQEGKKPPRGSRVRGITEERGRRS